MAGNDTNDSGRDWPLEVFDVEKDAQTLKHAWEEWLEAFELVLESKNVLGQREKFVLLMTRGGKALRQIHKNQTPSEDEVTEVKPPRLVLPEYDNAIARLDKYFGSKINVRMELDQFRSMKQSKNEDFSHFLLRLRAQANRCNFGIRTEDEILLQVTQGAFDVKVRNKRIDAAITLDKVAQYAVGREMLKRSVEDSKSESEIWHNNSQPVLALKQKPPARRWNRDDSRARGFDKKRDYRGDRGDNKFKKEKRNECGACGSWSHRSGDRDCRASKLKCFECQQMGHLAMKCPRRGNRKRSINMVTEEDDWKESLPTRSTIEHMNEVNE